MRRRKQQMEISNQFSLDPVKMPTTPTLSLFDKEGWLKEYKHIRVDTQHDVWGQTRKRTRIWYEGSPIFQVETRTFNCCGTTGFETLRTCFGYKPEAWQEWMC